jgi:hypothetical protein
MCVIFCRVSSSFCFGRCCEYISQVSGGSTSKSMTEANILLFHIYILYYNILKKNDNRLIHIKFLCIINRIYTRRAVTTTTTTTTTNLQLVLKLMDGWMDVCREEVTES